ncbi:MAG TPA: SDR family oxidoreductase [Bacteroidales bacterium]|nr:SDR family oxidoreductase [Bacteroidales bacterium]
MKDKTVVISGTTSGIGKFTALKLAGQGARLVMLARNMTRAQSTVEEIKKKTGNNNIDLYIVDLSAMDEIREIAKKISAKYPVIDSLINCAGMIFPERYENADGIELTFALNHLGYFLLTNMLLPNLKAAPSARIINVASEAQRAGKIHFDDLNLTRSYSSFKAYSQSKLANIMFTYELARRLEGSRVTANAVHPGTVKTGFGRDFDGMWRILFAFFKPFMRSVEKGAETVIWLATSPEVEGITGKYFTDKKQIRSKEISYDRKAAERLWEMSEKMTGSLAEA